MIYYRNIGTIQKVVDKYDDDTTLPPLISEAKMDESDAKPMTTHMLEKISGGIQSHLKTNGRETRYKIRDFF